MTRPLVALLLALGLVAAPALAQEDHEDHEDHVSEADGVRAVHAWTNATSGNRALVFVEIENASDAEVTLMGGEAENAQTVALVGFALVDGEPAYTVLPRMPIAAGSDIALAPNGLAIELEGLAEELHEGESFDMELEFSFGHLDILVDVEASDATQHAHAGHNH